MDEETPTVIGSPLRYVDGSSLTVETHEGLVRLVTRDAAGITTSGRLIAPSEAQQLGQTLLTAAFTAHT